MCEPAARRPRARRRVALLAAGLAWAAAPPPSGGEADPLAGWRLEERVLRFPGLELYGHINGGAERFHELGFEELTVRRAVREDGAALTLESYRMASAESALGIYLLQSGRGEPVPGVAARSSGGPYQISAAKGSLFIQVSGVKGDESLVPAMAAWANLLLSEAGGEGEPRDLFAILPEEGRLAGSERLFRGAFTLQPIYTFGPGDILSLEGRIFGAAADYRSSPESDPFTRIGVVYPDSAAAAAAFRQLVERLDPVLELLESEERRLVFRDFRERFGQARLDGARLDIWIHLADRPDRP